MAEAHRPRSVSPQETSALCLACGYCCSGELFLCVTLPPAGVAGARSCGLDLRESPTMVGFPLPCTQYRDRRCAVYDDPGRPPGCRTYQCWLLHRYLQGRVTAKHVRRMIRLADKFQARVARRIGPKAAGFIRSAKRDVTLNGSPSPVVSASEWSLVEGYLANVNGACDEYGRVRAELVRDIFRAGGFLRRHFVWPEAARQKAQAEAIKPADVEAMSLV